MKNVKVLGTCLSFSSLALKYLPFHVNISGFALGTPLS